jgi:hypothetical protein
MARGVAPGDAGHQCGLRVAAAAWAAAALALLYASLAVGHESHRHRARDSERAGIAAADDAQSRHEFAEARAGLDRLLAADPRDLEARLMSANLFLLAGEFGRAQGECRRVLETGALHAGTVCLASALTGPGSVDRARRMIAALGAGTEAGVELGRWRLLTAADLASRAGYPAASLALHERAFALDAGHEEARTRLAGLLLERGEARRALALAQAPDPSPARLVIRLRAARALADEDALTTLRELFVLLEADRSDGLPPHLREEAQLALYVEGDAAAALRLARRNFETQKDTPDLRMYAAAAVAAADAAAMAEIRAWMQQTGFEDRVVAAAIEGDVHF